MPSKSISLSLEILNKLEEDTGNTSLIVENVLREHYKLPELKR